MKKRLFIFCFSLFTTLFLNAQNTFPTTGNVGIGTANPSAELEVNGHVRLGLPHILNSGYLSVSSTWGDWMTFVDAYNNDTYNFHNPNNGGRLELYISDGQTNAKNFGVFTILKNGNIGIGKTNPSEKLHLEGNFLLDVYNKGNDSGIFFREGFSVSNKYNLSILAYDHSNSGVTPDGLSINAYDGISFSTGSNTRNEKMRIALNGNVGIGTTTPDAKLSVNGNIHTKEVKVDLIGWSDFVFEEDYNLPSLKEVENHIKEKGHLKDIPSAEEVKKNGIFLGEMDSKFLQKIEELTLYTINQEKRIESLESKNEKLIALVEKIINKKSE